MNLEAGLLDAEGEEADAGDVLDIVQGGEGAEEVARQLRKIVYDQLQRPEILTTLKQSRFLFQKEDNPISVDGKNYNLFIMNDDDLLFGKMSCIEM